MQWATLRPFSRVSKMSATMDLISRETVSQKCGVLPDLKPPETASTTREGWFSSAPGGGAGDASDRRSEGSGDVCRRKEGGQHRESRSSSCVEVPPGLRKRILLPAGEAGWNIPVCGATDLEL